MNRQDMKISQQKLQIRRATVEDAELLCRLNAPVQQLHVAARSDHFKPHAVTVEMIADYRYRLSNENIHVFIGEIGGEAVGYILAQIAERSDNPYVYPIRFVLIDQMSVNPDYRSKGYGELLMKRVFDLAKSCGIKNVVLTVWAFNQRAIAFYERQGFVVRDLRMEVIVE